MAAKAMYSVLAVVGLAVAPAVAWWWQHQPGRRALRCKPARRPMRERRRAGAPQPAAGSSDKLQAGGPPAVEVAPVERTRLADRAQAVGSLRSRQSVMLRCELGGRITRINRVQRDRMPVCVVLMAAPADGGPAGTSAGAQSPIASSRKAGAQSVFTGPNPCAGGASVSGGGGAPAQT